MRSSQLAAVLGAFVLLTAAASAMPPKGTTTSIGTNAQTGGHSTLTPAQGDAIVHGHTTGASSEARRNTRCYDNMRRHAGFSPCEAAHACGMGPEITGAVC
jgi:hypothetical protein